MLKMIFLILVFYCLFRLIFDFIIPISRATSQIKTKVRHMNEQQPGRQPQPPSEDPLPKATAKPETKDYIEFEEVKEKKS